MGVSLSPKLASIAILSSIVLLGYTLMSVSGGADPEYDLTIDNIPVNFDDNKTLYLDTQTNDRGFLIYNDHMFIRSQCLTFYDFNETYEHEDVNLVIGSYCYQYVPAVNLTLDTITPIDRFILSSWNGTVSVKCSEYGSNRMTLEVNSTDDATLMVRATELTYGNEYRVIIDGEPQGWVRVNWQQYFEYNYTGDWSNHTIVFLQTGGVTFVPSTYLNIIQVFLYLGLFVVVAKQMILPLKDKRMTEKEMTNTLIKVTIYIVVGISMISIVFHIFVGV